MLKLKIAITYFVTAAAVFILFTHYIFNFYWEHAIKMGVISCSLGSLIFLFWFSKRIEEKRY